MNKNRFPKFIAGAALVGLTLGCGDKTPESNIGPRDGVATAVPPAASAGAAGNVTVADITGNPATYVGRTVTVVADVEEVLGPRAFKLDEDNALAGGIDNDMLVLSPKAGSLANIDDQWLNNKVRVTGVVHGMAVVDIEREIGWDLDPSIKVELEKVKAVVVATSVERIQGQNQPTASSVPQRAVQDTQQSMATPQQRQQSAVGSQAMISSDFTAAQVRQAQKKLNDTGFHAGQVDGIVGPTTRTAITNFQQAENLETTGRLNEQTMEALGIRN